MELVRSRAVWIAARDDTGSTRTAGTAGQIGMIKLHAILSQLIQIGRLNFGMPISTTVIPGHVIRNENNKIGLFRRLRLR